MSTGVASDPTLGRLADAILIPPFRGHRAPGWVQAALRDGLGGVTVFGPNISDPDQLGALIARLRGCADEPLIAIDEEGGDVTRIAHLRGSPYPGNAALGAVDDVALTQAVYHALGADLAALGVNMNLAPSVDVNSAVDNPVIGTRSFGSDASLVARHAAAAVAGLQSAGVAACAKHFPGHGSTRIDTHDTIATVDVPMALLARRDLPPFVAAIAAGVLAVMPGHLRVPELTSDLPASLSRPALTGLLREELGFTGVIVSDALEMRAVSKPYGLPEAAVLAVTAGTDLLCFGRDTGRQMHLAVRDALLDAVGTGRLPGARLEEAAARVADLRAWAAVARATGAAGERGATAPDRADASRAGASRADGAGIGLTAARRAVRVEGTPQRLSDPIVVELVPPSNIAVGTVPWGLSSWVPRDSIRRIGTGATVADLPGPPGLTDSTDLAGVIGAVLASAAGRSLLIVVRDAHRYDAAREVVRRLLAARPDAVVVEMGLPVWRPPAAVYVATFGASRGSSRAAAEILGLTSRLSPAGRRIASARTASRDAAPVRRQQAEAVYLHNA